MPTIEQIKPQLQQKEEMLLKLTISTVTNRKKTKLTELTEQEIIDVFHAFYPKVNQEALLQKNLSDTEKKKWKSYILTKATQLGIKNPDSWEEFNHWMLTRSIYKKPLNYLNIEQLKQIHKQFLALEQNQLKSATKFGTKAYFWENNKIKHLN